MTIYNKEIKINPAASGDIDLGQILDNFKVVEIHVKNLEFEVSKLKEQKIAFVRTTLCEGFHPTPILKAYDHKGCKLISAYAQAADNWKIDNIIEVGENITNPITIKAGEKSGKTQNLLVNKHKKVKEKEEVTVKCSSARKVIVTTQWEEI